MPANEPDRAHDDDPRHDDESTAVPGEDAGPRPGEHPTAARSGTSSSTAYVLIGLLVAAFLGYLLIGTGIIGSN